MTIDRRSFLKSAAAITAATVVTGCAKGQQGDNQS
ncbi:MAG: twin-arginine translocation signal domain-containing protein [Pseudomonadota bacterium]